METIIWKKKNREKKFWGFDWEFALTDSREYPEEGINWQSVQLPHDWSVHYRVEENAPCCGSGGYARTGIGWYRKSFIINALDKNERIIIHFDGVYMNSTIWINGEEAGGHIYGYSSFDIDASDKLHEGINEIRVRVDNSHQPGSRWYTGSGITRDVYIEKTGADHIDTGSIQIKTDILSGGSAQIKIISNIILEKRNNEKANSEKTGSKEYKPEKSGYEDLCVVSSIIYKGIEITSAKEKLPLESPFGIHRIIETDMFVPDIKRWDVNSPKLYVLNHKLMEGEKIIDEIETTFGIRDISFNNKEGFILNGRKLILKGVCIHHDGGCVGAAVPPEIWERRLKKLKKMGANALRLSHNPSDPSILRLADELGFVVVAEAFDEWEKMKGKEFGSNTHESRGYSEWFSGAFQDDLSRLIKRDRNHPSIIMWSIGNEIREQVTDGGEKVAKRLAGLAHMLDDTRPVTAACDQEKAEPCAVPASFMNELDVVGVNYVDRWRGRTETFFDEEKMEHPDWILFGSEDVSVSGPRNDYSLTGEKSVWNIMTYNSRMLKAERLWKYIFSHKFVMGSFMWTGVDYLGECFWPDKSSYAGELDTCGFEKDGYYFYKSIWTRTEDEPVLFVSPNLNLEYEKGKIYPVIVYTNCYSVELFAGKTSYGVKAYEYPTQGMTKEWAHFDRPLSPITTNDLHLSFDVPYGDEPLTAVGRDSAGHEIIRRVITPCKKPAKLEVIADKNMISADGRSVVQLEIMLLDENNVLVTNADTEIEISVSGGELLGMDNGDSKCHEMYDSGHRATYAGLAYAVIRSTRNEGTIMIKVSASGLSEKNIEIAAYGISS